MRHFRTCSSVAGLTLDLRPVGPEVEARIAEFRERKGPVMFGGRLLADVDDRTLAMPDNLGGNLVESGDQHVEPTMGPGPEKWQQAQASG